MRNARWRGLRHTAPQDLGHPWAGRLGVRRAGDWSRHAKGSVQISSGAEQASQPLSVAPCSRKPSGLPWPKGRLLTDRESLSGPLALPLALGCLSSPPAHALLLCRGCFDLLRGAKLTGLPAPDLRNGVPARVIFLGSLSDHVSYGGFKTCPQIKTWPPLFSCCSWRAFCTHCP